MSRLRCCCVRFVPLLTLALLLPACTGTTKATTDPTTDLLSSTSGRTWFTEDGLVKDEYKVTAFTVTNFDNLKQEMAQGHGEYLASLGRLLGVPAERQADFFLLARERYGELFRSDRTTPRELLVALSRELSRHPQLSRVAPPAPPSS